MRRLAIFFVFFSTLINAQDQIVDSIKVNDFSQKCNQIIIGEVRDKVTNDLLPNTIVSLTDIKGNPVQTQMVTESAAFNFKVDCETTYKLTARKETYSSQSEEFTTSDDGSVTIKTKILLDKGRINFVNDLVEVKTVSTVDIKADAIIKTNTPIITTIQIENKIIKVIPPVKTVKNKDNKNILVLEPVFFDYESSYLTKQAKNELKKVIALMKDYPKMIIYAESYTDSKGPSKYNKWLSDRRAKRTIDFIIKRGINSKRISGKGFGDTNPINNCKKGVDCSDKERAINRRTEFVVVKS